MTDNPSVSNFADLIESLTKEIPYQQARFNYDFCDRLEAFGQLYERVKGTDLEALMSSIVPQPVALDKVSLKTSFRIDSHNEQLTSLRVQPLNLGFNKRFAYSGYTESRLEIQVNRITSDRGR
jgi:hypothetical protein